MAKILDFIPYRTVAAKENVIALVSKKKRFLRAENENHLSHHLLFQDIPDQVLR